ncbi:hypothetical protein DYB28_011487, partial [Aphanomyces astaci]
CGKHRTQNGSGYSNLTSHIEREHPEFVHYDTLDPATQQSVFASLTPNPVQAVHGWLTWITASLMPFLFCENDIARRFTTLGTISVKTLMKWMHAMQASLGCQYDTNTSFHDVEQRLDAAFEGLTSQMVHGCIMKAESDLLAIHQHIRTIDDDDYQDSSDSDDGDSGGSSESSDDEIVVFGSDGQSVVV